MSQNQTLRVGGKSYTFNSTGDRAKYVLFIRSTDMMGRKGLNRTLTKDKNKELNQVNLSDNVIGGVNQVIDLNNILI